VLSPTCGITTTIRRYCVPSRQNKLGPTYEPRRTLHPSYDLLKEVMLPFPATLGSVTLEVLVFQKENASIKKRDSNSSKL
jgi:hypothetical protein